SDGYGGAFCVARHLQYDQAVTAFTGSLASGVGNFWLSAPDPVCQRCVRTDLWIDSARVCVGHLEDEAMGAPLGDSLRVICAMEPGALLVCKRRRSASVATLHRAVPRGGDYRFSRHGTLSRVPS